MRISVEPGRGRRLEWWLHLMVGTLGGWLWLGNSGAALMALWIYGQRPPKTLLITLPVRIRRVKLSQTALTAYWGLHSARIFRDELDEEEFARLRRRLKASN